MSELEELLRELARRDRQAAVRCAGRAARSALALNPRPECEQAVELAERFVLDAREQGSVAPAAELAEACDRLGRKARDYRAQFAAYACANAARAVSTLHLQPIIGAHTNAAAARGADRNSHHGASPGRLRALAEFTDEVRRLAPDERGPAPGTVRTPR